MKTVRTFLDGSVDTPFRNGFNRGMLRTIGVLFLIGFLSSQPARAEVKFVDYTHITVKDGLAINTVRGFLQDRKGFLWLATHDGLHRYDGFDFTVFKNDPDDPTSLSISGLLTLYIDRAGSFWVGTDGGGLNKFDPEKETFTPYRHEVGNPHSLSHDNVSVIYEDRSGRLWIGTSGGALNEFDRGKEVFIRYGHEEGGPDSLNNEYVTAICEDRSGKIWIGTDNRGLNVLDRDKGTYTFYRSQDGVPIDLGDDDINAIVEDSSGVLWIGTDNGGLNRFDRETETFTRYKAQEGNPDTLSDDHVNAVFEDRSGALWVGTEDGTLHQFNRETGTFTQYKEKGWRLSRQFPIMSIFEDRSGVLWIGTDDGGVLKFHRGKQAFRHWVKEPANPNSLNDNHVMSVYEDKSGILWIGTRNSGLNRLDRKTGIFTHYRHEKDNPNSLCHNRVMAISKDDSGRLWVATYRGGVDAFDPKQGTFTHYRAEEDDPHSLSDQAVRTLFVDRSETLWVGTRSGLDRFNPGDGTFSHYRREEGNPNTLSDDAVRVIYEDRSGVLWIGTDDGLNRFDREKEVFTRYKRESDNPKSLSYDRVRSIHEDSSGVLWVGTRGGLNRLDRQTDEFTHFSEKNGLPSAVIYGINEDSDGYLWLSTPLGLAKFDPKTGSAKKYDTDDGLVNNQFEIGSHFKCASGEILLGGVDGLDAFFPEEVRENTNIPEIAITSFKVFDQPQMFDSELSALDRIDLSYKDNFFAFEFAALDYSIPEKNRYAYRMEGFDPDWVYCGARRYAAYTNLDPGEYLFRVKGANNDGLWNPVGASVLITITPPFWRTWWFQVSAVCAVVFLILGVHRAVTVGIRRRNSQLEEINLLLNDQVTEREGAEKALGEERNLLRTLIDLLPDSIYVKDTESRFVLANKAVTRHVGAASPEELIGKTDLDLHPREAAEEYFAEEQNIVLQGGTTQKENRVQDQSVGERLWVLSTKVPLRDSGGKIVGLVGISRDITKLKEAEEERAKLEAQVQQAQKLESLGVLAGGIAHDFNNLLVAILGNADLALDELPDTSPARRNLSEIEAASKRAADLCQQMLAYSGRGSFVIEPIDINSVVRNMTHLLKVSISKKVALRYNLTLDMPSIEADVTQLRQIIMNLITNASEAIGDEEGAISVSTDRVECDQNYLSQFYLEEDLREGVYICFEVTDTGCGMDRETIDRIFEPFFTTKFTGRGLGMSAVLGIVRGHKGAIRIYSEPGEGTTFKVLFPAHDHPACSQLEEPPDVEAWRGSGTILLVDDEESIRSLGKKMLERLGFVVLTAVDGLGAVELFRERSKEIACVLLDLTMPKMGGEETLEALRSVEKDVRVLISSGYSAREVTSRFVDNRPAGFLQKPYKMVELKQKLMAVLES